MVTPKDTADTYDAWKERLEEIVAAIQAPDVSVESALALHKEGVELIGYMEKYLQKAENHITKLQTD